MEYVQMTLDDWTQMKQKLRQELIGVKQSFVRIGYALRQIDDQRLYENDGYKSIAEFAKAEYGLEASTTSRFMSINREYSIDGYSEHLRPEYTDLGRSQLEEMLKLPDSDRQMIQPEASREDMSSRESLYTTRDISHLRILTTQELHCRSTTLSFFAQGTTMKSIRASMRSDTDSTNTAI